MGEGGGGGVGGWMEVMKEVMGGGNGHLRCGGEDTAENV